VDTGISLSPLRGLRSWLSLFAPRDDAGSPAQSNEPRSVLIIEDDLLIAGHIEVALTEAGFNVVGVATTGEEALELAAAQLPDLAVTDVRLAGDGDGVDAAIALFRGHGIRCIFASAYSDDEARQRAEPAAPLGWLQKPYSMASLTAAVRRAASELRGKSR
jgi:DNA-binding NarL/FixJ family response regulator